MSRTQPPRFAQLLLQRFGPSNPALQGDLAEEYQEGRSASWYWGRSLLGSPSGRFSKSVKTPCVRAGQSNPDGIAAASPSS